MIVCPHCAHDNPADARFCQNCGRPLERACPHCGTPNGPEARFCKQCGRPLPGPQADQASGRAEAPLAGRQLHQYIPDLLLAKLNAARALGQMVGERRLATILFCDVEGSTALAERLDPEDWADIMNGAFERLIAPIYRFEGTLARLMGDAILAFFGAPIAHEDDPQRAVLAGLEILEAMQPYQERVGRQLGMELHVRIGVNTGLVVVGEMGSDLRLEYTAMGDAVNVAARMEQTAAPDTLQIAHDTYRLVAPLFETQPLGPTEVKGKSEPVPAYRVLAARKQPGRLRGIEGLDSPLVGRERELGLLSQALEGLRAGRGQIIFVIGEAGLGKSRLIAEARRLWQAGLDGPAEPLSWSESRGISYDRSSPYAQFQQHLSHNIGRVEGEAPAQTAERLQAALAAFWQADAGGDLAETTAVLATLLDVRPAGAEGEGGSLSGEAFKQALYRTYDHLLRQLTGQTPAVRVFEDLHWCDPASLALLERLFELSDYVPLLFICTLRPHRGGAAWSAKNAAERLYPHRLQEIVLAPLSAGDSSALLAGLLDSQDLPARLRETLWEKAEGNPFYLEEIIRELIDGGILVKEPASNGQRRWRVTAEPQAVTIPETLQALLTARIDRLEEGPRHLLQLASVVGRTFSLPLLRASADRPEQLEDYLPALQRADLIRETGRRPEPTYHFRHGLTQEAAYESMLLRQRREAHGRIAAALESRGATDEVAGMLAHHFDRAGQPARAVPYYTHAGERAMRLYASMEASSHFSRALMLAAEGAGYQELAQLRQARAAAYETLGDFEAARSDLEAALELGQSYQDPRVALQASLDLGFLWAARDYERTGIYFNQALELAQASGEPAQLAQALNRVGNWHMNIGRPAEGSRFHEQALAIFEQQGDQQGQAASVDLLAMSNFSSGDLAESSRLFRQATELFRQQGDQRGLASALASLSMYGPASMADLAAPTQTLSEAAAAGREAAQIAAAIGWRAGEAHTLASLGATLGALGDFDEALACARGGLSIARQINHDQWAVGAQVSLASIHEAMLDLNMAADLLGAARDEVRQTGSQIWQDYAVGLHASILIRRGAAAEVGASLLKYLAASADSQLFAFRYIIRAAGELALAQGGPQAALAHFDRLVALAGVPPERLAGLALPYGAALEALSRADEALALLLLALELAEANQARPLAWQMRRALAGLYARLGRPAQAARQREAARELASAMAATISDEGQRQRYLEAAGLAEK